MDWNSNNPSVWQWYTQCPRDKTKWFTVYELAAFQRDVIDCCIWIKPPDIIRWQAYNSLYFSNGVIGVYDPSNVEYDSMLRIEFENPLDVLTIERGLYFSFLNQFELGMENEEVIAGIKKIAKIKH